MAARLLSIKLSSSTSLSDLVVVVKASDPLESDKSDENEAVEEEEDDTDTEVTSRGDDAQLRIIFS